MPSNTQIAITGNHGISNQNPDSVIISLWLHGKSKHTIRSYSRNVVDFQNWVKKPFNQVNLIDLQSYSNHLTNSGLSLRSVGRALSALKSLFKFAHSIGVFKYDTAGPLRIPKYRISIADRLLEVDQVKALINSQRNRRNRYLITLLFYSGIRVSECVSLRWKDLIQRENNACQITVLGKGGRTRSILLPNEIFEQLSELRYGASDDSPIFVGRSGKPLDTSAVFRIVAKAGVKAGIKKRTSPHMLRHSHATAYCRKNGNLDVLSRTLGHSSIAVTGMYIHSNPKDSSAMHLGKI